MVFAAFLASMAGLVDFINNTATLDTGMWIFTGYFMIGILLNGISRNRKERLLMTPVALALAVIFLVSSLAS